jgi:SAM-dependent methyltransferase
VTAARAVYEAAIERYVGFVGTGSIPDRDQRSDRGSDRPVVAGGVRRARRNGRRCSGGRRRLWTRSGGGVPRGARPDAIGIDVSPAMLVEARRAHPDIEFKEGRLDDLPITAGALAGAVCWYSIIYTPPERLDEVFAELRRVLEPGGHLLLAFQAGDGEATHRTDAHGTGLPLIIYRHGLGDLTRRLERAGFVVHATAERAPELDHESTPQAFVIARSRPRSTADVAGDRADG